MTILIDKAGFTAQMHRILLSQSALEGEESVDGMRLLQLLAGILVETLLLFDDPDEGLAASITRLVAELKCEPAKGKLASDALPPPYILDNETEQGRLLARKLFEEWLDCAWEFHDLIMFTIQNVILRLEDGGQDRAEILRIFMECATRCLSYEIAAQELCDIVIEQKMGAEGWSLGESVSGLSAVAGRCLGLSKTDAALMPGGLDQVAWVMTQEAVRLGIPAGTDWRFGLAANDCAASAPFDLIFSLWPSAREFFRGDQPRRHG